MKYYIDKQKFVVYSQIPVSSFFIKQDKDFKIVIDNPKRQKIYFDILNRDDKTGWVKVRLYHNKVLSNEGTRLEIFEAFIMVKPEKYFKIEGLYDEDLFDGRFNIQKNPGILRELSWIN